MEPRGGPGASEPALDAYVWAESSDARLEAISITLVKPDGDGPLAVLRPRTELPRRLTVAETLEASLGVADFAWGSTLAQSDSLDGWAVLIEPNGWVGSMPDVLTRLSSDGEAMNVFWNVNAVMNFSLARNGALVRQFDPLLYDHGIEPLPEESDLPWGTARPRASALLLMECFSGVRIEFEWLLERSRRTYVVPIQG